MKKFLTVLLALSMVSATMAFTLTGCGGGEKKEDTSASDTADTNDSSDTNEESSQSEESSDSNDEKAGASNEAVVGSWTLTSIISAEGESQTLEEYCAAQGVDVSGMSCNYTFTEDGKVTAEIGGIAAEGTYTVDGTTLTATFETGSSPYEFDAEAGTLTAVDANTGIKSIMTKN